MFYRSVPSQQKRSFILLWVLANIAGWLAFKGVLGVLGIIVTRLGFPNPPMVVVGFALAVSGMAMGLMQWFVLRHRFPLTPSRWLLATAVGLMIGGFGSAWAALLDLYILPTSPTGPVLEWDSLISGAILGLAIGSCQSLVWWPAVRRLFVWIIANVMGWSAGLF